MERLRLKFCLRLIPIGDDFFFSEYGDFVENYKNYRQLIDHVNTNPQYRMNVGLNSSLEFTTFRSSSRLLTSTLMLFEQKSVKIPTQFCAEISFLIPRTKMALILIGQATLFIVLSLKGLKESFRFGCLNLSEYSSRVNWEDWTSCEFCWKRQINLNCCSYIEETWP